MEPLKCTLGLSSYIHKFQCVSDIILLVPGGPNIPKYLGQGSKYFEIFGLGVLLGGPIFMTYPFHAQLRHKHVLNQLTSNLYHFRVGYGIGVVHNHITHHWAQLEAL